MQTSKMDQDALAHYPRHHITNSCSTRDIKIWKTRGKRKSDSIRAQFAREMKITDPADYEEKKTLSQSVNDSTHREGSNASPPGSSHRSSCTGSNSPHSSLKQE